MRIRSRSGSWELQFVNREQGKVLVSIVSVGGWYSNLEFIVDKEELTDSLDVFLGRMEPVQALRSDDV